MDDRFISATYKNWSFGTDFSGLLTNKRNIYHFINQCKEMKEIQLAVVNATATLNLERHKREELSYDQDFAALVTSLKLLSRNGNLIMISYTMFSAVNVSLMYFLNLAFKDVHLFKPSTSPMTKCEFYIIGIHFKKDDIVEKYIEEMLARVGPNSAKQGFYLLLRFYY